MKTKHGGRTACLSARLRDSRPAEFRRQSRRNVRPRSFVHEPKSINQRLCPPTMYLLDGYRIRYFFLPFLPENSFWESSMMPVMKTGKNLFPRSMRKSPLGRFKSNVFL